MFRQLEALSAALVRRESTLGVKILAGLSACLVQVESLAWKKQIVASSAQRDNRATQGPPRVHTVVKDKLYRGEDGCALSALRESTKSVRQRVRIAQPEKFLPKERTRARTVM